MRTKNKHLRLITKFSLCAEELSTANNENVVEQI